MVTASPVRIDRGRVAELTEREQKKLDARTTKSGEMFERARRSLSGGVASSYQVRDPWPIYLEKGRGSKVWDVDGTEMVDFHNGFGSMVQGHARLVVTTEITLAGARAPSRHLHWMAAGMLSTLPITRRRASWIG